MPYKAQQKGEGEGGGVRLHGGKRGGETNHHPSVELPVASAAVVVQKPKCIQGPHELNVEVLCSSTRVDVWFSLVV